MQLMPEYAGFWRRGAAVLLDMILFSGISTLLLLFNSQDYAVAFTHGQVESSVLSITTKHVLPMLLTVILWLRYKGTPGKLLLSCNVVDADSHTPISLKQALIRYVAYFFSSIPMGLGFLWMLWDPRRQAWHDKLARTIVVIEQEADKSLAELRRELRA